MANALGESAGVLRTALGRSRTWPQWILGFTVAGYAVALMLHRSEEFDPFVDGWLGLTTVWLPAAVCGLAVYRTRFRRLEIVLAAAAVTAFAAGDTYYVLATAVGVELPYPSLADIGYLGFYPFMLASLVVMVGRQIWAMAWPVILDGTLGTLGAAAVLAVLVDPLLQDATDGPTSWATGVALAYPLFDLLLVAAFVGIGASQGRNLGSRWMLLVLGLVVFAATDLIYASLELNGVYSVGTPLDAGWAAGLSLIALWVHVAVFPPITRTTSAWSIPAQTVPVLAIAASLGVLVFASRAPVSTLGVVLASLTLILAVFPLVFRQRIRLADIHRQTMTDELTGLPNRLALYTDVPPRLNSTERRRSALLLLDLDKFKEVNDSLGHDVGDLLLVEVAKRLSGQLRETDILARLGGDDFAIHLAGCDSHRAESVAVKLRKAMSESFVLDGIRVHSSASIGIAIYPDQGESFTVLLRKADMAMYKAKNAHSGHHVYTDDDDGHGEERLRTLEELHLAMREDQLVVYYQPQVNLTTGEVSGVEALVRWNHPTQGLLSPDGFLVLVKEAGMMHLMTQIVLEKALDQAAIWKANGRHLTVSVNLSAGSLMDAELPATVGAMLASRGLPPSILVLEVTEDLLMEDRDRARDILTQLRSTGIGISVDDFGTGYSSLAYLRDLPIDELKLDKSFVLPMADDPRATALVASTIDLAHSLGLRMVAEGVQNAIAYSDLASLGCDIGQGFHLSRPIPADEFDVWLANYVPVPGEAGFDLI